MSPRVASEKMLRISRRVLFLFDDALHRLGDWFAQCQRYFSPQQLQFRSLLPGQSRGLPGKRLGVGVTMLVHPNLCLTQPAACLIGLALLMVGERQEEPGSC